jgi:histidyl-tRNA synthetase
MSVKPKVVKGTRDFLPEQSLKRKYIFNTLEKHFKSFGFQPIETPAMEDLSTLTGKYGEEGDRLIFKILNSGDFKKSVSSEDYNEMSSVKLGHKFTEKALRYDLTVPFARFVVNNRNEITFPFKRYQIQPVWRADRPQKGRYREFFQCDADVVGSDSLFMEVELVQLYYKALSDLKIPGFVIKINNRKLLSALAEKLSTADKLIPLTVAIDKLDKIGLEKVIEELVKACFTESDCDMVREYLSIDGDFSARFASLKNFFGNNALANEGLSELDFVFSNLEHADVDMNSVELDLTLARGLEYYTGAIFEVKVPSSGIGSICGGGRYNNLTGIFGLPDVPGIGISFGADRIYDVLEELDLFPKDLQVSTQVLFPLFEENYLSTIMPYLSALRTAGISAEVYPEAVKMKKQMKYANDKQVAFVALMGDSELEKKVFTVKNMSTGEQSEIAHENLVAFFQD